ncbi:hypothetical protein B0I35DRAFT_364718 [Stachybotrys elegans]|uniref:Chitin-binding type-3 domain-containing protein n=1 Tax=Stachybotrys elegans TaxID=80388 RepID=A0A8K0SHB5_9HYPO|nr:hypothetical protein B0I35DRAFT_364718 [Stachybotrys elegans]
MAEPLFHLLLIRPPVVQSLDKPSIQLAQASTFQKSLLAALEGTKVREESTRVSRDFIQSEQFIKDLDDTVDIKLLRKFGDLLDEASSGGELPAVTVLELARQVYGTSAAEVVKKPEFVRVVSRLKDSIVAIKFVQEDHGRPLEDLVKLLRDAELLRTVAEQQAARRSHGDDVSILENTTEPSSSQAEDVIVAEWQPQVSYAVGALVVFNGIRYVCIQAHTSLVGWEPPKVPALWVRVPATDPNNPDEPDKPPERNKSLFGLRNRSLILPSEKRLDSILKKPEKDGEGHDPQAEKQARLLLARHSNTLLAIRELKAIDTDHLVSTPRKTMEGTKIDFKFSSVKLFGDHLSQITELRGLNAEQFRAAASRSGTQPPGNSEPPRVAASSVAAVPDPLTLQDESGSASAVSLTRVLMSRPDGLTGSTSFTPQDPGSVALKLKADAPLSDATRSVLKTLGVNHEANPLPDVVRALRADLAHTETAVGALAVDALHETKVTMVNGNTIVSKYARPSVISKFWTGVDFGGSAPFLPRPPPPDPRIPHTKGKIQSIGVGDLIIVRQQLIGYEGADIAHVENVLKGESKKREHTSTTKQETVFTTEEETTTEDSHELATTNRFEMSQETQKQIKEQFDIKGSLQVTAKYGPAVELTAKAEGGYQRTKETATKTASKFAQDVTEKSTKKIVERLLKKQTVTTSTEVVELNAHGIDNTAGPTNVSGVYQWVNKVYEAQMFNYGLRALFDFMVPEPGAFLIQAMTQAATQAPTLEKPPSFPLWPIDVTETNYGYWVNMYRATDVKPPPPDYVTVSDAFVLGNLKPENGAVHNGTITIDQHYEAVHAKIGITFAFWEDNALIDVIVGSGFQRATPSSGAMVYTVSLGRERTSIPWAVSGFRISSLAVTVAVHCVATEDATNEWKADTHAKLLTAYKARMQEYDEKLATLQMQAGIVIQGRNPAANAVSIKQELKKNCISIITGQHYDDFNSIINSPMYGPRINLYEAEGEGEYVRFFEQAFEWENMMYVMYDYFWGRKNTWGDKLVIEDTDPEFEQFLKAGFCRVQVPARPGFEAAIDHFMTFGELWNGGPLPAISSPLFLPIADEIAERAQKPGNEVPQGAPWKVRIPTSLVKLRQDDKLPKWKKNADGEWVPDES